eukprot:10222464-Alexandrium_andersonii.AAC.1
MSWTESCAALAAFGRGLQRLRPPPPRVRPEPPLAPSVPPPPPPIPSWCCPCVGFARRDLGDRRV